MRARAVGERERAQSESRARCVAARVRLPLSYRPISDRARRPSFQSCTRAGGEGRPPDRPGRRARWLPIESENRVFFFSPLFFLSPLPRHDRVARIFRSSTTNEPRWVMSPTKRKMFIMGRARGGLFSVCFQSIRGVGALLSMVVAHSVLERGPGGAARDACVCACTGRVCGWSCCQNARAPLGGLRVTEREVCRTFPRVSFSYFFSLLNLHTTKRPAPGAPPFLKSKVPHHLHLLARQPAPLIKRRVRLRTVQDDFVTARGPRGLAAGGNEFRSQLLAPRRRVHDHVLDVPRAPAAPQKLALDEQGGAAQEGGGGGVWGGEGKE